MSTELRFIEREVEAGVLRILQFRHGPCYPWVDVPLVTIEQQHIDSVLARDDAQVKDYK